MIRYETQGVKSVHPSTFPPFHDLSGQVGYYCILLTVLLLSLPVTCLADDNQDAAQPVIRLSTNGTNQPEADDKTVNPFGRFLMSAAVPGLGEISLDSNSGYAFLGVELLLWGGRFYFLQEIDLHEQDAYIYALQNAGLRPGNYSDEYLHLLSRYNSSGFGPGGYNEYILLQAQRLFPDDPERQNQYILDNAILDDDLAWEWGSRDQRRLYAIKRRNADHCRDYVKFITGAIIANHIVSAINSMRIANRTNRLNRIDLSLDFSHPQSPMATLHYRF